MTWQRHTAWETALTPEDHTALSALLRAAFPGPEFEPDRSWPASWARKEFRVWLTDDGRPVAHLGFERRLAGTAAGDVLIAGVGDVAVAPSHRGRGLGSALMDALAEVLPDAADFGFLQCREEVAGFYAATGWTRVPNPTRHLRVRDARSVVEGVFPTFVRPGRRPLSEWPSGLVDLRGLPW
ncbi:GNAT family N-acetyltransferase [Dactylosporangium sp. NPDC000244]|uniref:GNAT family N-acetyltransferase n=1 Tax=Dactylosporangium sp. NPDC000244 TaxID=3154365 RepID=UPI003319C241